MYKQVRILFFGHFILHISFFVQGKWLTTNGHPPRVIGHRGDKAVMPEHTIGSYAVATVEGADYVEPELMLTKDGVLVCFSKFYLKGNTDVVSHSDLSNLQTKSETVIDGPEPSSTTQDWLIKDLTLAQLRQLTVTQENVGKRPKVFNNIYKIPTFEEYLETIHQMSYFLEHPVGIIPELKFPKYHNAIFGPNFMEDQLLKTLSQYGYNLNSKNSGSCISKTNTNITIPCGRVIIQSYDEDSLIYLKSKTVFDKMILIDRQPSRLTYKGFKKMSKYAERFGFHKELLYTGIQNKIKSEGIPYNEMEIEEQGGFIQSKDIVPVAHNLSVKVSAFTIFDSREPSLRGCSSKCDPEDKRAELDYLLGLGIDSFFVENIPEMKRLIVQFQDKFAVESAQAQVAEDIIQYQPPPPEVKGQGGLSSIIKKKKVKPEGGGGSSSGGGSGGDDEGRGGARGKGSGGLIPGGLLGL